MTRPDLRDERGFTMMAVMVVMLAATMLAGAALLAAEHDLPFSRATQDRKQAYGAAEAGIEYYRYQLAQDNDYWARCADVPAPAPVNQRWNGTGARRWRDLPGTNAAYTIELLPAAGATCSTGTAETTMLDAASGTFRIRATGRSGDTSRSIVASFRRRSFLDFLYFTDYETLDPSAYPINSNPPSATNRAYANANCVAYRPFRGHRCTEIQFISADANRGPFHTNDDILACGGYTLGRRKSDRIEIAGPGRYQHPGTSGSCDAGAPNILGTLFSPVDTLKMPSTNAGLALQAGITFEGRTTIRLHGDQMDVWTGPAETYTPNVDLPANGVIYVKSGSCPSTQSPLLQSYDESSGCANVTVYGEYSKSLTIASAKDIVIGPKLNADGSLTQSNGDLRRSGDAVLGLIADNFVRVQHSVARSRHDRADECTNRTAPDGRPMFDVRIDAAILSLNHSFIVDNYACGAKLGTITVNGAIAQKFRGPVGTVGSTGFLKDYNYDDRLRYRSPPFFLDPVSASWGVVRQNEQVPAAAGP
jgi:hypothetical protein